MNQPYFRLSGVALVVLLAFIAMAETPRQTSGIEGVIFVSPSRPGPVRKDVPDTAPAGNLEFVVKRGDQKVTSFTTDMEGGFRVFLPPGHYLVLREDPGAAVGGWRFEADVVAGEVTKVQWTGDSGMR